MAQAKIGGITKEIAQKHLDEWLEAELAVTTNQSYHIGSKSLTRANLDEIRKTIEYWSGKVKELEAMERRTGRNRVYRAIPLDN